MRNLNFLRKSERKSVGTTLALTVGSPSAHRRSTMLKLLSVLVLILTFGVGNVWGTDVTYTFTSKSWADASSAWTGGGDGNGFTTGQGIQVTTGTSGANATSKSSFSNVTKIVVTYNTNQSKGAGSIEIKIGTNAAKSNSVGYSGSANGTSANFTTQFDYSTAQSGAIKITTNTTTNSIWVKSITITYSDGGTPQPTALAVPTGMSSGTPGMTSATLSWNPVEHAESYALTIGTNDPITTGFETVNNKITYTLNDLESETTYTWKVKATTTDTEHYSNSADCAAQEFETAADPNLLKVVYDFTKTSDYPSGFPTASGTSTSSATEFTFGSNTLVLYAPNNYYRDGSHLFFGKTATSNNVPTGAYIEFPARSNYKLTKVVLHENSGAANGASLNIWSTTNVAMSTAVLSTNVKGEDATFVLTNPAYNTAYRITAASSNINLRFDKITLTYAPKPAVSSISIKTAPTKTTYTANENFDPSGLVITVNYEGGSSEDVTYNNTTASDFTFAPALDVALNATHTGNVTVTYGTKTANQAITVNRIATSLSWSANSYAANIGSQYSFPTLTKTPSNLSGVTFESSNTDVVETISAAGVPTVKAVGTTTITAKFAQTNVYAAATDASYTLTINAANSPALEVDPTSLTFDLTEVGQSSGKEFALMGEYLTANASLAITGDDKDMFSVTSSVAKDEDGSILEDVTVTYSPTAAGNHSATLTISSTDATPVQVALSGSANVHRSVTWVTGTGASAEGGTASVWDGAAITAIPTQPTSCDEAISFMGWTDAEYAKSDNAPSHLYHQVSDFPAISGNNASYYAVWAAASGDDGSWSIADTDLDVLDSEQSGSYDKYKGDQEKSDITFNISDVMANSNKIQLKATTGTIYNKDVYPGHISSIVIVYDNSDTNKNIALKIGDSANPTSGTSITPTNNGNTYTFDCSSYSNDYFLLKNGSGAGYVNSITINYAASIGNYATTCSAPVEIADPAFSPAAGSYNEDQNVTITAEQGMTIYYSFGAESNPKTSGTAYTGAISVTEDKVIKAIATDGDGNWSGIVTKTYEINYSSSIAAFIAKAQNSPRILKLNAAQNCIITGIREYEASNTTKYDLYIQDINSGIIAYGLTAVPEGAAEGKRIEGTISGTYSIAAGQHRITGADFTNATFNTADALTPAEISAVDETAYNANPMMLVSLSGVYYNNHDESSYDFTSQAEGQGTSNLIYDNSNKFAGKTMPANTVACNITGVIVKYNETYELFPYSLTTATPAVLPTITPTGGADVEHAVEVTYLSTVSVSLVDNEDIYVSINDAAATKLTEAASIQIENDTKIAVTAKRDFHADNAITYFYKPSSYPKQIEKVSAHGTMLVKVGDNEVSTALPTSIVNVTVSNVESHFTLTGITVKDADNGDVDVSESENVYSFTMPNKNVTITANYSEDTHYTITYSQGDATGGSAPAGALAWQYAGEDVELLANAYTWDDDHKFTGWKVTYNETEIDKAVGQTFQMPAANVTITAQWAAKQYCALTLRVNGQDQTPFNVERLVDYDLTSHNPSKDGYTFYGWAELNEDVEDDVAVAPSVLANHIFTPAANEESKKLYAVFKHAESVDTKDVLTAEDFEATTSGYVDFSGVSKTSAARYAGSSALDDGVNIQLRSKNSNSGIVSTTSGGTIKSVKITVAKGSNTVDVYGSHSAYEDATSLFGNSKGTNIGSTSTTGTITPTAQQVFEYVGIRSNDGAIYLSSVEITWTNSTYTYTTIPATLYDVTYTLGEGEWSGDGCPDTQVKEDLGYTICTEDPVRDGYKFVEWQIGGVAKSGEITISGNTEIVAVWTPKAKSALTYAPGVGSGEQQTTNNVEEGTVITLPSIGTGEGQINFSKTGYKFVGWNDGTDTYASGASFTMPAQDVTLTAQWIEGVDFTWVAKDGGYGNGNAVTTATTEPIAITFAKGDGSTAPTFYGNSTAGEVRMYKANTVTIATAADDQLIKSIVFTFGGASNASLSGNGLSVDGATGTWSGLAKTLTFINNTASSDKAYVEAITVTYANGTVTTLSIVDINLKTSDGETALNITKNVDATIIYEGLDESVATIADNKVTPVAVGSTTVTARIAQGANYTAAETEFTITVAAKTIPVMSFPQASYDANLGESFTAPTLTKPEGVSVAYSSDNAAVSVDENTGAITINAEGTAVITATSVENEDYSVGTASYTLNVIDPNKDVLTVSAIAAGSSYADWSNKEFGSTVKYAGNSMTASGDHAGAIQMRNTNPSGIVTTSAIGYLKSISAAETTNGNNSLEIYAKGSAYESSADLYSSDEAVKGVKIGTIGKDGGAMVFVDGKAYSDNYKYIGIKPVGGAVYYDDFTITWTPVVFEHFDVTYKAGEATGDDIVESIEEGSNISLKAANTYEAPEGKMFAGWLLAGEENAREAGSKYTVTAAATFTAQWVQVYTITYLPGEAEGEPVVVENVPVGNYSLAANTFEAPESKEFAGWKLNNEGESLAAGANYNVTGNASFTAQWSIIKQPAGLAYATTSYMITRGRSFEAPELTNPYSLAVTYSGNNDEVATVNATTGAITLKGVVGEVTVTATSAETDYYYAGEASYTLKVKDANLSGGWVRLTNANTLVAGMKVIVAQHVASGTAIKTMGEQKTNNRGIVAGSLEDGTLVADEGTEILTLVAIKNTTNFALKTTDNKYLFAAGSGSGKNYLKSQANVDGNATWAISLSADGKATIIAQGTNTNNKMQYNQASTLFACYSGTQQDIALYSKTIAVDGNTNASTLDEYADVVVADNATLVINTGTKPLGNITGNVTVNAPLQAEGVHLGVNNTMEVNSTVNVPSFSISVKLGSTGQATNVNVDVNNGGNIAAPEGYVDMELADGANPDHWHSFTVPFEVDALNGIYDAETGAPLQNEVNYAIMDYHGDIRANGQYGWKKYRGILQPGVFYLITIDGESKVLRFMKKEGSSYIAGNSMEMTYFGDGDNTNTNNGWCGVGNQNMFDGYVPQAYVAQVLNAAGTGYEPIDNTQAMSACIPFFIQVNVTVNLIMNTSAPSLAPRRMPAKGVERMKVFFGNENYTDKLFISASEEATNQYEIGKDLLKMTMSNTPNVPQIFGNAYGNKLCMIDAPMVNDQATYGLTLYAPAAGEYTISAPAMDNADLYLTLNGAIIWNLSMGEYTSDFAKGNNEGYGLLLVKKAPQVTTGVENAEANETGVQKVIINEHVYILRAEQMYDVTGKLVK